MSDSVLCPRCGGTGKVQQDAVHIGDLVASFRRAKNMTQEKLSQDAGISRGQLANLETGRTDPSLALLRRLANALGCSTKDLVP